MGEWVGGQVGVCEFLLNHRRVGRHVGPRAIAWTVHRCVNLDHSRRVAVGVPRGVAHWGAVASHQDGDASGCGGFDVGNRAADPLL